MKQTIAAIDIVRSRNRPVAENYYNTLNMKWDKMSWDGMTSNWINTFTRPVTKKQEQLK